MKLEKTIINKLVSKGLIERMLFYVFSFLFLFICPQIISQRPEDLPIVIPPSPIASTFTIYGNYPVSHSTGVPDIQIPLYSFKSGDIEVPIVLKYHIGSAKPSPYNKEMSNIGFGWVLESGGVITRTVLGRQDDFGEKLSSEIMSNDLDESNFNDYETLRQASVGLLDTEYDIFNYSFFKGYGNFIINKNVLGQFDALTFPYQPWKFQFYKTGDNTPISGINIKDDNGNNYYFSDIESNGYMNTGWFISQINSTNNRQVNFVYANRSNRVIPFTGLPVYTYSVNDYFRGWPVNFSNFPPVPGDQPHIYPPSISTTQLAFDTKTIKEINSSNGKVVFTLNNDNSQIESFIVYDSENQPLKRILFHKTFFPGQNVYIRLDSISIQDSNFITIQKYTFQYNSISILGSGNVDYWGCYNGISSNYNLPQTLIKYVFGAAGWGESNQLPDEYYIGSTDKCIDNTKILAQTLEKITYPTGGSTEFIFEPNEFHDIFPGCTPGNHLGGGLRIKSIINRTDQNEVSTKTYLYEPGIMYVDRFNPIHYIHYSYLISGYNSKNAPENQGLPGFTFERFRTYTENLNLELLDNSVRYTSVSEYIGTSSQNIGKNVYTYSYDNKHELIQYNILNNDNTVLFDRYKDWSNGLLRKTEVYKHETNNTYSKVKETIYDYRFFNDTPVHSLKVFRISTYPTYIAGIPDEYQVKNLMYAIGAEIPMPPIFFKHDYFIQTGGYVPTKVTETQFLPNAITVVTSYLYENGDRKYPTKITLNENSPNMVIKSFKYPYDFNDEVYSSMVALNKINYVVELIENRNGSTNKTKTNYKTFGANVYAPETIQIAQNSQNYHNRFVFGNYDLFGNVWSVSKANDLEVNYIWSYNHSYPVIKAENIDFATLNTKVASIQNDLQSYLTKTISDLTTESQKNAWKSFNTSLRNTLPSSVFVTTFTYKPHVGMTSQTDPNGVTTYYEYDSFGRLKFIKDDDNHILKSYEYHYNQ